MKSKLPANPFPDKVRALFLFDAKCFRCGRSQNVELDHITGRGSNNPYNACPLCRMCHIGKNSTYIGWQLRMIREFLNEQGYKPTKKDLEFLSKYKKYYDTF